MFINKTGRDGLSDFIYVRDPDAQFEAIDNYIRIFFDDTYFIWISKYFNELIKYTDINKSLYMNDLNAPRPVDPNDDFNFIFSGIVEFDYK